MNFKEIKVVLNKLNEMTSSIRNKEESINGMEILFVIPPLSALVFGSSPLSLAIILFGGLITIAVLIGLVQKFFDSLIQKDKNKIIGVFNNNRKDITLYLYENTPQYVKRDLDNLKVSIMKEDYIIAIEQINKLLNEIESTTERDKNIKDFDNLMKSNVIVVDEVEEKEKEMNITYQL